MSLGIPYQHFNYEMAAKRYYKDDAKANKEFADINQNSATTVPAIDVGNNTCTDGIDDGEIGFFSKVGNAIEGVWNMGKNLVTTAIKHPFKTAAMIGVCCIPVVGPAIGAGLAAYGLYQGGKQIVTAAQIAENATTDAEAKAAWENIGSGVGTTALSAVGLKGSLGALKGQLAGGSTMVQALKGMKGATKGELVKTVVTEGLKETGANFGNFVSGTIKLAKAGLDKLGKGLGKTADMVDDIRTNGFKETVTPKAKTTWKNITEGAGNIAKGAYTKVTNFFKSFSKEARADLKAQQILDGTRIDVTGKTPNAKGLYEVQNGNTTTYYNKQGLIAKEVTQVGGRTVTVNYKNGVELGTITKYKNGSTTYVSADGNYKFSTGENYIPRKIETPFGSYKANSAGVTDTGFSIKGSVTENILNNTSPTLDAFYEGTMGTNDFLMFMSILDDIEE